MMARLGPGILWLGSQEWTDRENWERPVRTIPKWQKEKENESPRHLGELPEYLVPEGRELFLLTSGSTGLPRIAVHRHASLHANATASLKRMPLAPDDRWLLNLPLFHVGGLGIIYRCAAVGAGVVITSKTSASTHITHLSVVTAQLTWMAERPGDLLILQSMKAVLLGGGPVPRELCEYLIKKGVHIWTSYGLTEMASQVATGPFAVQPGAETRVEPLEGIELKRAPDGEIHVRGPSLFLGYLNEGQLSRPLDPQGYYATGDLGDLSAQGLAIFGRRDNLMISGGENIQPEEVEAALRAIPQVNEVVVVPRPHPSWGQRPIAFIKMAGGLPLPGPDYFRTRLTSLLPKFKWPDEYHPWPVDPQANTASGKVNRAYFRALGAQIPP